MVSNPVVTLRNYRCFKWNNPAQLVFTNGFTAIVGPNNSGKSSALRSIYELRNFFSNIFQCISSNNGFSLSTGFLGVSDPTELANDSGDQKFQVEIEIPMDFEHQANIEIIFKLLLEFDVLNQTCIAKKTWACGIDGEIEYSEKTIRSAGAPSGLIVSYRNKPANYRHIINFINELAQAKYFPAFRNAINEGAGNYYDIPIGTALVQAWDQWKAGSVRAHKMAISEVERKIAELLGFNSLQINADQSGKTLDVTINGKPHKLYEVGSGVAQLIIVLAASLIANPSYILIDEPELSLHPLLQLNFLSTLASYSKKGIIFSTHSIGLARSSAEKIFITRKIANGGSSMEPLGTRSGHFMEMLGELGYSGRVELGCEKILMVEGATDVILFQEFLRKFGKDGEFVVMQLGGASLINSNIAVHIAELCRLVDAKNIHIYIDSEKTALNEEIEKSRKDFIEICTQLKIRVASSLRRATENYFDDRAIKLVLGDSYNALSHYQLLKESAKPWGKSDNWKIARETTLEEIKNTDLGEFLNSL